MNQVVTIGSRFNDRTVVDSPVPIDVLSSQELQRSGYTELAQALSVLVPSIDFPRSANTDGTDSVRPLTLRNLGPGETLVLLDDKRYHTSALVKPKELCAGSEWGNRLPPIGAVVRHTGRDIETTRPFADAAEHSAADQSDHICFSEKWRAPCSYKDACKERQCGANSDRTPEW